MIFSAEEKEKIINFVTVKLYRYESDNRNKKT